MTRALHHVSARQTDGSTAGPSARKGYRPDIDGLRALSILSVVAFHVGVPGIGGGFVGVDVFFVISGYLISTHIYKELQAGVFRLRVFYERRTKRILPAFFTMIALVYAIGCLLLASGELQRMATQAISALSSTSNIYFWLRSNYFAKAAETQPLLMTWSLGVEEQFYLLFPILLIACRRLRREKLLLLLAVLSAISLAVAIFQVPRYPSAAFFLLPSRWWELGTGTLLGIASTSETWENNHLHRQTWLVEIEAWFGFALLAACVFGYHSWTQFPGLAAVPPVLAAMCFIRAERSWFNRHVLGCRPLVLIGVVSYSWYLFHWPLLSFAHSISGGSLSLLSAAFTALASLGLAWVSYAFVEAPFRRAPAGRLTLSQYAFATAVCLVPAVLFYVGHGLPIRYPQAAALEHAALEPDPGLCLQQGTTLGHPPALCRPATTPGKTLAILGDSHASALARFLRTDAKRYGWNVTEYTKASCPPLGRVARASFGNTRDAGACYAFNQAALVQVLNDPNIQKVLLAGFWSAPFGGTQNAGKYVLPGQIADHVSLEQSWANLDRGLDETIALLQQRGKTVVVAIDAPHYEFDPLLLAIDQLIPLRRMLLPIYGGQNEAASGVVNAMDARDLSANSLVRKVIARRGAQPLDLAAPLCQGNTCSYKKDHQLLYSDFNHLSVEGVRIALGRTVLFASVPQQAGHLASNTTATQQQGALRADGEFQ